MEKEINPDQMRLLALVESRAFAELSAEEKAFVLTHMSERGYEQEHHLMYECKSIPVDVEPRKLIVPPTTGKGRVVPLYQAVAGIAAAIVLTFLLVHEGQENALETNDPILALTDTVYVDRTEYDTIVQYQIKYILQHAQESTGMVCGSTSTTESSNLNFLPIGNYDLKNRGSSASDDESLTQVVDFSRIN